tara:strand:- start:77 stop:796 length:720 start_codon:yes stop_codon:yes gene_type:complete
MSVLNPGTTFSNGEQLTASDLNLLLQGATFTQSSVDNQSTQLVGTAIVVADSGIIAAKLAADAVTTSKILNANVTKTKIENVADYKVLGNVSGAAAAPQEVAILDEDDMVSDSDTSLATQQSIKAYVDAGAAAAPARGYNSLSHSTASGTIIENTTGRPLFVSFTLFSNNDIYHLLLDISPNSNMTGGSRIAQTRIVSDGSADAGGQVCGIVPDGWYWKVSYSGGGSTLSEKVHCSFAL